MHTELFAHGEKVFFARLAGYGNFGDYRRLTALDGIFLSKRLLDQIKEPSKGWSW